MRATRTPAAALSAGVGFVLLVQFGGLGPPLKAYYDGAVRSSGVEGGLLASLFLDVSYTLWFALAVLGILVAVVTQGVCLVLGYTR